MATQRTLINDFNAFAQSLVGRKVLLVNSGTVQVIKDITVYSSSSIEVELEGFFPNDTNSFTLNELTLLPI